MIKRVRIKTMLTKPVPQSSFLYRLLFTSGISCPFCFRRTLAPCGICPADGGVCTKEGFCSIHAHHAAVFDRGLRSQLVAHTADGNLIGLARIRLHQMEEVTHQMFRSLEDVIDTHWDEVNVQCNYLYYTPLKTDTEFYRYLKKLSELSNYHERQIELIAVDSAGHYYTENGRMGLLRGMKYLESAPQRVSYVSNSLTVDDSRMVFLELLSTPITLQSGEKEITLCYFGISQSMTQLNDYFRCDAYENNNSVYVLDDNGFKLFNANDTELLKGHNVYTVLSRMSYLHGSSFAEAKERLDRTGSCYSNAVLDGTEYFYALKQMENAQWTLAISSICLSW